MPHFHNTKHKAVKFKNKNYSFNCLNDCMCYVCIHFCLNYTNLLSNYEPPSCHWPAPVVFFHTLLYSAGYQRTLHPRASSSSDTTKNSTLHIKTNVPTVVLKSMD